MAPRGPYRKRRARRLRLAVLIIVILACSGWAGGFVFFVQTVSKIATAPDRKTQAIVVLTGGSLRLQAGLDLLSRGLAEKLFVSGVHRGVDVAELLRISRQTPKALDCCIVLGYAADNTRGNAQETAAWMDKEGYRSMRLVTANYHMPRSLFELRQVLPNADIIAHAVSPVHVKLHTWWISPGTAFLLAREYTKLLLARLRSVWQPVRDAARAPVP
jgi:uncharacterized SAM-binding protein YcdF (DUF218 family)